MSKSLVEMRGGICEAHPAVALSWWVAESPGLKNPPKNPEEYLETLALQGLKQSVERLRDEMSRL